MSMAESLHAINDSLLIFLLELPDSIPRALGGYSNNHDQQAKVSGMPTSQSTGYHYSHKQRRPNLTSG